jgi:hypothetical protein
MKKMKSEQAVSPNPCLEEEEDDLRGTGWEGVDWMHFVQDRDRWRAVVNTVMNLRVP